MVYLPAHNGVRHALQPMWLLRTLFQSQDKEKNRYCDRVRTDNGRTCKQIGPPLIYRFRIQHSDLLADYDKAINCNYRRVERYELKLGDEKQGKDLPYNDYADWLRELHSAKIAFMSGEMSEEEFMESIHLLDWNGVITINKKWQRILSLRL